MKKITVLVVSIIFYVSVVPIVAETLEITEARIAGENDAKGFHWKWFAISCINSSGLLLLSAIWVSDELNYFDEAINNIDPRCCLVIYGIQALAPTVIAMTHSPAPPAERLLGKSPDWIETYTKAYQKHMKRYRTEASVVGCVTGTATIVGTLLLIVPSISGNTPG